MVVHIFKNKKDAENTARLLKKAGRKTSIKKKKGKYYVTSLKK